MLDDDNCTFGNVISLESSRALELRSGVIVRRIQREEEASLKRQIEIARIMTAWLEEQARPKLVATQTGKTSAYDTSGGMGREDAP